MGGVGLALALALMLWTWLLADDKVVDVVRGKANVTPGLQSAGSPASLDRRTPATPTTAPPVPWLAPPSATTALAVPITVAAPRKLLVGEKNDLVVGVGASAGINEISFTVRFDANVLQVRAGTEGDWSVDAGLNARFVAEIPDEADRVQIRSAVSGQRAGMARGSVAIVQFQAVAPGTTSVLITDVVVKDFAGRSIASAVSASNLQVTVDSVPPPQPEAWRQRGAVAVEPPTETTEVGD
jgi:hypothetical protein